MDITNVNVNKKRWTFFVAALCVAAMLCGCSGVGAGEVDILAGTLTDALMGDTSSSSETEESSKPAQTTESEPISTDKEIRLYTNPLTGEACMTDLSLQRPYAFMVNNFSIAMPLCGIAGADWVFEIPDENSITKMMFLYADPSSESKIGSIRTARRYNVEIALGFDAILVHSSEDEITSETLASYGLAVIDAARNTFDSGTFFLDSERQSHGNEHSLFAAGAYCMSSAEGNLAYRTTHQEDFSYGILFRDGETVREGELASNIVITYAGGKTTTFLYVPEDNTYTASQYGDVIMDNGEIPVAFANVFALYAPMYPLDEEGHMTMELKEGTGYFFTEGIVQEIRWYKDDLYDSLHFETTDGKPIRLTTGKSFVAITQVGGYTGEIRWE